jgi:hypothetical protein
MISSRVCWTAKIVQLQVKDFNRKEREESRKDAKKALNPMCSRILGCLRSRLLDLERNLDFLLRETEIRGIFKHLPTKGRSNWRISQLKR